MGYNEYIDIYYGNNATGIPLYSEKLGSTDSYKVYEPEDYCFPYGDYYAVLGLNYMGIWDINSKLTIKQNGVIFLGSILLLLVSMIHGELRHLIGLVILKIFLLQIQQHDISVVQYF